MKLDPFLTQKFRNTLLQSQKSENVNEVLIKQRCIYGVSSALRDFCTLRPTVPAVIHFFLSPVCKNLLKVIEYLDLL